MVKIKKGRQTNTSQGRKRATPPRLRQLRERRKANEAKLDEIDITTLPDDDPQDSIRSKVRGFISLMGDDSSEDDDTINPQETTPRKGEDKKRQRFATETEIVAPNESESVVSVHDAPAPIRLADRMDFDSSESVQSATIAEILGEGPDGITTLSQVLNIAKDCRYTMQVKVHQTRDSRSRNRWVI
jgi:hypothetical protein